MHIVQSSTDASDLSSLFLPPDIQLLLVFGARALLQDPALFPHLRRLCPSAHIVGCSTAGEIFGTEVRDDSIVLTGIRFASTRVDIAVRQVADVGDSYQVGQAISQELQREDLCHVLVLSDGLRVNGSDLVKGLREHLPSHVNVTGGLAGDGSDFRETVVLANGDAAAGQVVGIGFYGDRLQVGYGSVGGWDAFGPERLITRSKDNVLYELDSESALGLYKTYLGSHAADLPSSGLLFPLALRLPGSDTPVVRTILGVDETQHSMTFAGDMPEGCYVQLMKANFNRLVDGAIGAAEVTRGQLERRPAQLAILISCIGRKLVLKQRIEEEVEGVAAVLGEGAVLAGFYSYGEIAPHGARTRCELHNQTMTVTTLSEEE
ncbi:FIST signal transduction protein [Herbaspirillum sp. RV1423]|uniref:FIST signal transduction protein n=1 Tax=Herbaspirillum sp. RV1423 TaxID=1443993 RepID=UPI0004B44B77|nr:FIST N-terminal domain-containing protein [Herbaspirillum sp. RV1423]